MSHAGIDVSKDQIDVAHLESGAHARFAQTPEGLRASRNWLLERDVSRVALEATGGYERAIADLLTLAGMVVLCWNPRRSKRLIEGLGYLAKTDRVDAAALAETAAIRQKKERPWVVRSVVDSQLRELVEVRLDLVESRTQTMNRLKQMTTKAAQKLVKGLLRQIEARIANVENLIRAQSEATGEDMAADLKILQAEKGIGWVTAITLLVLMPEIGTATRVQISALAGLAPLPDDSGQRTGRRHIRGGRKSVRCAMYMASLAFVQWNEPMHAMYLRLRGAGKEEKVARTAVMRKMLVRLNAKLRDARAERASKSANGG